MLSISAQVLCVLVPALMGLLQGIFALRSMKSTWYRNLIKAPFHPPGFVVFLSFMIINGAVGYASVRVCNQYDQIGVSSEGSKRYEQLVKVSLVGYLIQFTMNGIWPILFFICKKPTLALIQIFIADTSTLYCTKLFYTLDKTAGYLALPHFIHVLYWTILLYTVWVLNRNTSLTLHENMLQVSQEKVPKKVIKNQYQEILNPRPAIKTYGVFI